jgi:hypothetical protein
MSLRRVRRRRVGGAAAWGSGLGAITQGRRIVTKWRGFETRDTGSPCLIRVVDL